MQVDALPSPRSQRAFRPVPARHAVVGDLPVQQIFFRRHLARLGRFRFSSANRSISRLVELASAGRRPRPEPNRSPCRSRLPPPRPSGRWPCPVGSGPRCSDGKGLQRRPAPSPGFERRGGLRNTPNVHFINVSP